MKGRASIPIKTTIAVAFLTLAGEIAWGVENQFFNVFMYNEITKNTFYISLMVAMSAITATITAIIFGALSDKIGRRKVFFMIGLPMWAVTTALFPIAGYLQPVALAISIAILFDCVMTFFGSMSNDATLKAYTADVTVIENRGRLNAVIEFAMLIAILIVYGASGFVIEYLGYYAFFYIIGGLVGIIGIIGALLAPEPELTKKESSMWKNIISTFSVKELKANKDILYIFLAVMVRGIAFNVFFPFLIIFLQHYHEFDLFSSSILIFVSLLVAIIASIPMGYVVDKVGRKTIAIISVFLETIMLILFALSTNIVLLGLAGAGMMFAMMLWDISVNTWTKDLYPEDKRGQFAGFYMIFFVLIPMIIGPFIGSAISQTSDKTYLDEFGSVQPIPPPLIFIVAGLLFLLSIPPLLPAKDLTKLLKKQRKNHEEKELAK